MVSQERLPQEDRLGLLHPRQTVLATVLAAAALWGSHLRRVAHSAAQPVRSRMALLHRIHAARVGDQVAWLLVGAAVLAIMLL